MTHQRYLFRFSDILSADSAVTMAVDDCKPRTFFVGVDDNAILDICQITLDTRVQDLIDLAVVINTADRLAQHKRDEQRHISVSMPVRNQSVITGISEQLQDALFFATHDDWHFEFTHREDTRRFSESQLRLPFPEISPGREIEVALWSGGLDSLAGLCNRIEREVANQFILVGSGSNSQVFRLQNDVIHILRNRVNTGLDLVQVKINRDDTKGIRKDRLLRSRGLVFLLIGAAVAISAGVNSLHVYENGIGAINLPYYQSEIGIDHSRSVHPISLAKLGAVITQLMGWDFEIRNPFVFNTKAQMCISLQEMGLTDLIVETASCDRPHRLCTTQCGVCSSCLLRKQALAASSILDSTRYVVPDKRKVRTGDWSHFNAMLSQVETLVTLLGTQTPWENLCREYPILRETAIRLSNETRKPISQVEESLVLLYQHYVDEWNRSKYFLERQLRTVAPNNEVAYEHQLE